MNSTQTIVQDGDISVRPMRDEEGDYRLLAKWLTDERVLEFYMGRDNPYPYERAVAKYRPRVRGEEPVQPCLISQDGRDVGYIQYYPVGRRKDYELEDATDTYGADMFIGEPEYWSRGIGSRALAAVVRHIFDNLEAQRVVIDPHIDNLRAIRAYEKAGFRKVKALREHELHEGARKECWLMVVDRDSSGHNPEDEG